MKRLKNTITVIEDHTGDYHVPGVSLVGSVTLCGWVDVPHNVHDAADRPVTCKVCMEIIKYCKNIKI